MNKQKEQWIELDKIQEEIEDNGKKAIEAIQEASKIAKQIRQQKP